MPRAWQNLKKKRSGDMIEKPVFRAFICAYVATSTIHPCAFWLFFAIIFASMPKDGVDAAENRDR